MFFQSSHHAHAALGPHWRWPNFTASELACKCAGRFCGGAYWHDSGFLDRLQTLRDRVARPINVTSAHRCPQWNACVGGAPLSRHKRLAVDISVSGHDRQRLYRLSRDVGFTGFGLARSFIHLDCRAASAVWYYSGSEHLWQT
ncbi:MAG: D-Ala-D-Ala carboxypeptidase family metallohydrolase [Henriciella sp.]